MYIYVDTHLITKKCDKSRSNVKTKTIKKQKKENDEVKKDMIDLLSISYVSEECLKR